MQSDVPCTLRPKTTTNLNTHKTQNLNLRQTEVREPPRP
jgi:hypothetical protein